MFNFFLGRHFLFWIIPCFSSFIHKHNLLGRAFSTLSSFKTFFGAYIGTYVLDAEVGQHLNKGWPGIIIISLNQISPKSL